MRKLTNAVKYDIIDGIGKIYMISKLSGKFELAFECNPATIDFIKQNGLKEAFRKSLLCVPGNSSTSK